ncbi:aspartate aminotransferase [Candidatus Roizmanbacteria bacterium CG_4_9_14_3_um_filter_33_18]|uniref:Aminotransferase n=1 Tax=Candidatus Roizmanbacteria bacterium CG_4_9_14_3_um_filter_33_18 TaxID=1974841 RepID=A0A2M7XYV1_9BACT|nr:MAG: aspartate aminotransferase [Candidatus Roizmanbacteria bacterium CG_4_9_14_3_um_filter_33_18]
MKKLSKRALAINPSLSMSITAKAKEMKRQGLDVVSFSAGEPDFDTMFHIKEAAKKAIDEGFTKYTASSGIIELKEAICAKFRRDNWLDYEPKNIIVSTGAKQCLFNIIMVLVDPGDEVIVPIPYYLSYEEMIKIAEGKCVFLKTNNFKINSQDLEKAITPKTKMLILNSPSNPTGVVYDEKELKQIASICLKHNIYILSDEIYEKIIYGKKHVSIASVNEKIKKLVIVVNGVSKSYAMTGWRIGYAAAEEEIIKAAARLQDHTTSNPTSISQKAALAALEGPEDHVAKMVYEYKKRRDFMVDRLNRIDGVIASRPDGAFYVFANISKFYGLEVKGSLVFAQKLLEDAYVAVISGIVFGDDRYIRLSFATGMEHIKRGLDRLEKFCEKVRK